MNRHSWHDPYIIHTGRSLLKALYMTLGAFLFLFVSFHIGTALYISNLTTSSTDFFQAGIAKDFAYLKEQGDAVANNELIQKYLITENHEGLLSLLQEEKKSRSIGLMGVANEGGIIVSRTLSTEVRGDNVFLTAPVGRVVAQGKSAESIELTGFINQLFMTTGRPIVHDGEMIGALFANYLTDDSYANRFRDLYLPKNTEVVFYTKEYGVYGDSFKDKEIENLIKSYFNTGSEWIQNGSSDQTVSFSDGTVYFVRNIVFPGLEKSPGGALIFVPRIDISLATNVASATITVLIFCILISFSYSRRRTRMALFYSAFLCFVASLRTRLFCTILSKRRNLTTQTSSVPSL
jgi:hypothetical protein